MKKIPTLFERVFDGHKIIAINDTPIEGMEWVLNGEGTATIKFDGACCAMIDGVFYKRYDAKQGKKAPEGAIPCTPEPDPITGHWPHWVKVDFDSPADKWFVRALESTCGIEDNATYEAVGLHFNGNPYEESFDYLVRHNDPENKINVVRTFEGIQDYLTTNKNLEGIVFWKDGEPQCKIKRTDFGLPWPVKKEVEEETSMDDVDAFEITMASLRDDVQEELVRFLGDNCNYDVFPIVTLYRDRKELE